MGRRVENDLGGIARHDLFHPLLVGDVGDQRLKHGRWLKPCEFLLNEKQRVFRPLDEQELVRRVADNLAADLGTDRPAGAGHHDDAARN